MGDWTWPGFVFGGAGDADCADYRNGRRILGRRRSGAERRRNGDGASRVGNASMARMFGQLVRLGLLAVGAVVVLGTLGINVSALVAGLGLTGLVIGLALNQIMSNALAGIMVIMYKPFRENDQIAVTTFAGRVSAINLRFTTLEAGGKRMYIPNAMVISNVVVVDAGPPLCPPLPRRPPRHRWEANCGETGLTAGQTKEISRERRKALLFQPLRETSPFGFVPSLIPRADLSFSFLPDRYGIRGGVGAAVGDAHENLRHPELLDQLAEHAADGGHGAAAGRVANLNVAPGNPPPPAGPQRLKNCLLGRPAPGKVLRRLLAVLTVANLLRRVDAGDEQLAVPLNHAGDPQALRNIGSNAKDVGHGFLGL